MPANDVFAGLEPAGLWLHFAAITRIPRPSRHEAAMAAYVKAWAQRLGYAVRTDAVGNLCVQVPCHPACAAAPVTVLQSHLDMVCERNADSPHDPERGDIHVVRDGDWLRAEGTTLGADNGIGVAAMLYAGERQDVKRGPLDLLFTIDEETGLTGATALDPALLRGRVLLNLDSEDDGELCIGCAGSRDVAITFRGRREPIQQGWTSLHVEVGGLLGGHSGTDIHKPRANAIRVLARVLRAALGSGPCRLATFTGGNKRNAIPREAAATICVPDAVVTTVSRAVSQETELVRRQYASAEAGLRVTVSSLSSVGSDAWSAEFSQRLLDLVVSLPCGVIAMSPAVPGLVETSNSLGTAVTEDDEVRLGCLLRSSNNAAIVEVAAALGAVGRLAAAETAVSAGYPGWLPNPDSRILGVVRAASQRLFGRDPKITAVHAGLECGIIGERVPGMDMVSFGPDIHGAHAPGERVGISSVGRFWQLLSATLEDLAK